MRPYSWGKKLYVQCVQSLITRDAYVKYEHPTFMAQNLWPRLDFFISSLNIRSRSLGHKLYYMTRINVGLAQSYVKLLLSSWKTYTVLPRYTATFCFSSFWRYKGFGDISRCTYYVMQLGVLSASNEHRRSTCPLLSIIIHTQIGLLSIKYNVSIQYKYMCKLQIKQIHRKN